jgi:membrane fusion protein, multidrug efflux system
MKPIFKVYAVVVTVAFLSSCSSNKVVENPTQKFPIIQLKTDSILTYVDYVADIEAVKNIEIRPRHSGYIEKIHVDEGQFVKEGDLLFSLSNQRLKNELDKTIALVKLAKAESRTVELEMQNSALLVQKGVVDKIDYELAKAKYDAALAKVEDALASQKQAELILSHSFIHAPFSGFIDRIPFKQGSYIEEGQLLSSLSDISTLNIYFSVSETEYLQFAKRRNKNATVQLLLADGTIFDETGVIETMEGDFEEGTGTIAFRAKFNNSNNLIRHNSTGKIRLTNFYNNVYVIPQKSVFEIQDRYFVYVMNPDNTVEAKSFEPELRFDDYYIVKSGFKDGTKIVYEGTQKLKNGVQILPELQSNLVTEKK